MYIKRLVYWLPLVLSIVALPLALTTYIQLHSREGDTIIYESGTMDSEEAADIAARALDKAEQNNEMASTILSLLEGGSVLLTIIVAAVAAIYTLNLRDLRQDLESQANNNQERIEAVFTQRETELERLTADLSTLASESREQMGELSTTISERLEQARQEAENAFRVLSLQLLAEQQVRARNYDSAIVMLLEAYELEPRNQSTNYLLGYLYIAKRQFEDALRFLRQALDAAPQFAPSLAAMGLAQRRLGDQQEDPDLRNRYWAEAEVSLGRALQMESAMLDADGESYWGTLGGLYRRQSRYEDAVRAYERAVEVTPNSSYPMGNLAVLYKCTGKDEQALEMFGKVEKTVERIIEDSPGDWWARLDYAQSLLAQDKDKQAFAEYQEIINRQPPTTVYNSAISALRFLRQAPTPIPRLEEAIALLLENCEDCD